MKTARLIFPNVILAIVLLLTGWKSLFLWVYGHQTYGQISAMSTTCLGEKPIAPKPQIYASFMINGDVGTVGGRAGHGNKEFCSLKIGDPVLITAYEKKSGDVLALVGDAQQLFYEWSLIALIISGIALGITVVAWRKKTYFRND